ncbi:MAG: hypothetical protein AAGF11_06420 [Myxococcota bacterium]
MGATSAAGSSTGPTTGPSLGTTVGEPPGPTFGQEGPGDDGSEVGFVGPLDLACAQAVPGVSPQCALCDVREQSCVDGFRCVAWAEDGGDAWNGTRCIEVSPDPVGVGQICTLIDSVVSGLDDCPIGSMCWDADPVTLQGTCVPFCGLPGDSPVCPAGTECMIDGAGALALCLPPCDPLASRPCAGAAACRYFAASRAAFCIPDQGGRVLSPTIQCGDDDEPCPGTALCISAATYGGCGSPSCCTRWCDTSEPDADAQCAAMQRPDHVCVAVFDRPPIPADYASLGICAEPVDRAAH